MARRQLWATSGHLDFYSENMFEPISVEDEMYQLKPMNCPFHIMIYKARACSAVTLWNTLPYGNKRCTR